MYMANGEIARGAGGAGNKEIGKKAVTKIQMIEDDDWNQSDSSTNSKSILGQLPKKE